eukprot:CAMPEP_0201570778 /NCGR_PEP_ID=MMETSP0190_2-20130828/13173_1 /ASSEMBLY_ACC=CAM_ASM_000263 /TAXON_ID=37353 /ORGANISM="Rosalina sp." /LENGTH=677 /DNA_ID=CAMNT_0047994679 /DNA_START=211 /DNA_END=2244 /DNA_ORIENTATION=-
MAGVGTDQYLPDNMEDNSMGFNHQSPGGDIEMGNGHGGQGYQGGQKQTAGGGGGGNGIVMQDSNELNETQKLQLAERANEIYRQQLKYMQDHLASLRSLIQDKENIIENLMLRYDLGIITQDQNRTGGNLSPDEIEMEELRRKAEALAQRTILENFELREMVNELRDENFHLRNEIYELQDKINRQVLQINKLEKQQQNASQQQVQQSIGTGMDDQYEEEHQEEDIYGDVEEDDPYAGGDDEDRLTGRRGSQQMDHPKYSEEAIQKREERAAKHVRKESVKPPDLFENGDSDEDEYMDDAARAKRAERQNKARKESIATPDIYGDQQGDSEEDVEPQGQRRRGSQVYMDAEAQRKREERQAKHRRGSSVATPNIFHDNYDPEKVAKDKAQKDSPEAVKKRLTRKAKRVGAAAVKYVKSHRRKESLAEKLLLGPIGDDEFKIDDPEERKELQKKARQEQRRKSRQLIKSQVGAKEHFSDDDVELQEDKPQRSGLKARKKSSQRANKQEDDFDVKAMQSQKNNKKRPSITADAGKPLTAEQNRPKHRRDSSTPIVNLGFEDPDVLLHYEKLKVQDLEKELEGRLNELDKVKQERDQMKGQFDLKNQTANKAVEDKVVFERELDEAIQSKADLAQKCAMEIMRLTMILNTLQQMPKFKEVVQILMDESVKEQNKNGSLLG